VSSCSSPLPAGRQQIVDLLLLVLELRPVRVRDVAEQLIGLPALVLQQGVELLQSRDGALVWLVVQRRQVVVVVERRRKNPRPAERETERTVLTVEPAPIPIGLAEADAVCRRAPSGTRSPLEATSDGWNVRPYRRIRTAR